MFDDVKSNEQNDLPLVPILGTMPLNRKGEHVSYTHVAELMSAKSVEDLHSLSWQLKTSAYDYCLDEKNLAQLAKLMDYAMRLKSYIAKDCYSVEDIKSFAECIVTAKGNDVEALKMSISIEPTGMLRDYLLKQDNYYVQENGKTVSISAPDILYDKTIEDTGDLYTAESYNPTDRINNQYNNKYLEETLRILDEVMLNSIRIAEENGVFGIKSNDVISSLWLSLVSAWRGRHVYVCKSCGRTCIAQPERKNRATFCSDACRVWWHRNADKSKERSYIKAWEL